MNDDRVFKALADRTRRHLLDRLFEREGRTLLWTENTGLECHPARRLVHTWRSLYDKDLAAEAESRVTWEIEPQEGGYSKLTVVHGRLEGAPKTAKNVSGGWMLIRSGLKTLVETGEPLTKFSQDVATQRQRKF